MNRYTMKAPRIAFGAAAAALTTVIFALLVLAPAVSAFNAHPAAAWAATGQAAATATPAETVTVLKVVGTRDMRPVTVTDSGRAQNIHG
jgi:hypothetical protein